MKRSAKKTVKKRAAPAKRTDIRPAAKKTTSHKKSAPAARRPAPRPVAKKKPAAKKTAAVKKTAVRVTPVKPAPRPTPVAAAKPAAPRAVKLSAKDLEGYRQKLLALRDRLVDEINFLSGENLNNSQRDSSGDLSNYGIHMADQGTDNFDREFALSIVSNGHDALYEIDAALQRIKEGTYGTCEMTGQPIEKARLEVLPYARFSLAAQSEMERRQRRGGRMQSSSIQTLGGENG